MTVCADVPRRSVWPRAFQENQTWIELPTGRTTAAFLRMPGELRFGSLAVVEIQMASGHCSFAGLGEKTPLLSEEGGIPSRQKIEVKAMRYGKELEAHLDHSVPEERTHPHLPTSSGPAKRRRHGPDSFTRPSHDGVPHRECMCSTSTRICLNCPPVWYHSRPIHGLSLRHDGS